MTPAEDAFNALYPVALRVVALHRRCHEAADRSDHELSWEIGKELVRELDELERQVHAIEAGAIDGSLSTSIAGVLSMLRRRDGMKNN